MVRESEEKIDQEVIELLDQIERLLKQVRLRVGNEKVDDGK